MLIGCRAMCGVMISPRSDFRAPRQAMMPPNRFRVSQFAAVLSGLAVFAGGAVAQTTVTSAPPATFTLGNGLQVVVIPDHRTPVVTQMIWYKVGSAGETH